MNTIDFDSDMPSAGSLYLRVKEKGDQLQFRIAQNPGYEGKHFLQFTDPDTGEIKWEVPSCPRINDNSDCEYCDLFFAAKAEQKKLEAMKPTDKESLDKIEGLKKEARKYGAATTFYFPVLNRTTGKMGILQTTGGVRNKVKEFHDNGTNIFEKDFVLRNTGKPGKERYALTMVDSADTAKFTDEEKAEYEKAQNFDLNTINDGSSQTDEIEE